MATGKGTKWSGDAHGALAVALARIHGSITPEQQEALVKDMNDSGLETTYTWEGIRQHLQKLKKKDGDKKGGDAPTTPKKATTAPVARGRKSATPKNKRKQMDVDEDEDDKVRVKKLKLEPQAPNLGQYDEDEPNPPSDGEI